MKIWFQNRRMKWKRSKKSTLDVKPKQDADDKVKADKTIKTPSNVPPPEELREDLENNQGYESCDSPGLIDVEEHQAVIENIKCPLIDHSNIHKDMPTDLSMRNNNLNTNHTPVANHL